MNRRVTDLAFRALAVLFLSLFVVRAGFSFEQTHRPLFLLLIVSESLTVVLVVVARATQIRSMRPLDIVVTILATYYFLLFVRFDEGQPLLPSPLPELVQACGIGLQVYSKYTLGRSFGLLPANRGVVANGPYRLVRHPIYLSYFLAHVGFLLGLFTLHNLLLIVSLYALQISRMLMEERVLTADPAYAAYAGRVRWRFIPGVF